MQLHPVSPAATADQNAEYQQKESDRAAALPLLPWAKDIYATLASTIAHPMDAEQYYQCVLRELPANHGTLQGWRRTKGGNNEWGPEDDFLREDTWDGNMDTFLEAAAKTYPRPPADTWHGLHALFAFHSWKHHHNVSLHPLDHNPQRWTPENGATTAVTIQQDPENPTRYHLTWSDPASHPAASPTLQDIFATISAGLPEAKAPQQPDDEMPQAPPPPTAQERPPQEPVAHPISTMEFSPQHRNNPGPQRFRTLPREWAIHNGTLRWDEITPGLQAIRLHSIIEPTDTWGLPADRHHLPLPSKGMPPLHQQREPP